MISCFLIQTTFGPKMSDINTLKNDSIEKYRSWFRTDNYPCLLIYVIEEEVIKSKFDNAQGIVNDRCGRRIKMV